MSKRSKSQKLKRHASDLEILAKLPPDIVANMTPEQLEMILLKMAEDKAKTQAAGQKPKPKDRPVSRILLRPLPRPLAIPPAAPPAAPPNPTTPAEPRPQPPPPPPPPEPAPVRDAPKKSIEDFLDEALAKMFAAADKASQPRGAETKADIGAGAGAGAGPEAGGGGGGGGAGAGGAEGGGGGGGGGAGAGGVVDPYARIRRIIAGPPTTREQQLGNEIERLQRELQTTESTKLGVALKLDTTKLDKKIAQLKADIDIRTAELERILVQQSEAKMERMSPEEKGLWAEISKERENQEREVQLYKAGVERNMNVTNLERLIQHRRDTIARLEIQLTAIRNAARLAASGREAEARLTSERWKEAVNMLHRKEAAEKKCRETMERKRRELTQETNSERSSPQRDLPPHKRRRIDVMNAANARLVEQTAAADTADLARAIEAAFETATDTDVETMERNVVESSPFSQPPPRQLPPVPQRHRRDPVRHPP